LALREEISGEQQWHEPLQKRSAPDPEGWAKPAEKQVTTFMHDEIGSVDEEKPPAVVKGVKEKDGVECQPR
jgi:hypothetical protein